MIGHIVTEKDGNPVDGNGTKLSRSEYQPPLEVMTLFERVQRDYQTAYTLQHRSFDEFDGISLVDRMRLDQQTFAAYVGAEYVPVHKRWRWRGRKNTSRNKLIGILAHMLAAMLFPYVRATNDRDEDDKMAARVMGILVEEHLRRAGYETKFLYLVLSALVNPAVVIHVEYVEAMQKIKQRLADGTIKVIEAVDEILSGIQLNMVPIDEFLIGDFYTGTMHGQPFVIRVRRISYDTARSIYGHHPDFKYVEAGKTKLFLAGSEAQTLFDIDWTEADQDYVQEITFYYRPEDLEVCFIGGVFMGNKDDIYNSNPFSHRRLTLLKDEWSSVPIYPFAKTGFEPIDPTGRFFYYKSGAFKEYWDDQALNTMNRLALDGTYLDVIKPIFGSGIAKMDTTVIVPGAFVGMPPNANVIPYQLGPNLAAAYNAIMQQEKDLSESTQDKIMQGTAEKGITAYATAKAEQNARIFLGVFGIMMADLITKVGELTMDCLIRHTTVGEIDTATPESLKMKFHTVLARTQEKGKNITNRIVFTDKYMGRSFSKDEVHEIEWDLYEKAGGDKGDQRIYEVNPFLFARNKYSMYVDADRIIAKSMGTDQQRSALALQILTSPAVAPYTDQEAVIEDFAIEPFSDGDSERYKRKADVNQMMGAVMGGQPLPAPPNQLPTQSTNAQIPV